MRQAADAGAGVPADLAEVRTLLGDLHLGAGRLGDAEAAYRQALAGVPGYAAAEVGLARVTAARGRLAAAAGQLDAAAQRLPLPGTVALLGDVRAALGQPAKAADQYRLVRAIEALNRANGVVVDLELARFEADHAKAAGGDAARAVAMARKARAARPTVYADDTLAWALRQAGRPREALPHARAAVRLGTRDALLWYHLAAVEADLGMRVPASGHLATAFAINPYVTGAAGTYGERKAALALAAKLGIRPPAAGASR
jgi:tetratricopeptide (TPR) repeat protein